MKCQYIRNLIYDFYQYVFSRHTYIRRKSLEELKRWEVDAYAENTYLYVIPQEAKNRKLQEIMKKYE